MTPSLAHLTRQLVDQADALHDVAARAERLTEELASAEATAKEALGALAGEHGKQLRNVPAEELFAALMWASGSAEFAIGPPRGSMRDGFETKVLMVLRKYAEHARREP